MSTVPLGPIISYLLRTVTETSNRLEHVEAKLDAQAKSRLYGALSTLVEARASADESRIRSALDQLIEIRIYYHDLSLRSRNMLPDEEDPATFKQLQANAIGKALRYLKIEVKASTYSQFAELATLGMTYRNFESYAMMGRLACYEGLPYKRQHSQQLKRSVFGELRGLWSFGQDPFVGNEIGKYVLQEGWNRRLYPDWAMQADYESTFLGAWLDNSARLTNLLERGPWPPFKPWSEYTPLTHVSDRTVVAYCEAYFRGAEIIAHIRGGKTADGLLRRLGNAESTLGK